MGDLDFVVIGGGSAGYAAARKAVDLGLTVAVVDGAEALGGLCILRGCMPSKTLIETANRVRAVREAKAFGFHADLVKVDPDAIMERKRRLISDFADYRRGQLEDGAFELIRGRATFADRHRLRITLLEGGVRELAFKTVLVATGSEIQRIPVEGLDQVDYLTSDDVLERPEIPESVVVVGGGAIALELAHYYEGVGSSVTVIQRSSQILTPLDEDVAGEVEKASRRRGIHLYTGTRLLEVGQDARCKWVRFCKGEEERRVEAEALLLATGRVPNTAGLGLEGIGVTLTQRGAVAVGANQASLGLDHVFAAGDAASPLEVVHIAVAQGEAAAYNAARLLGKVCGPEKQMDYRLKLFGIFCDPEVATVGMTEREARAGGSFCHAATYPFNDHGKSMIAGAEEGIVKLISDEGGRLIGGAAVGPHAIELIHEVVTAMAFHATAAQLAEIPHYHPTLSEIWTYPAEALAAAVDASPETVEEATRVVAGPCQNPNSGRHSI